MNSSRKYKKRVYHSTEGCIALPDYLNQPPALSNAVHTALCDIPFAALQLAFGVPRGIQGYAAQRCFSAPGRGSNADEALATDEGLNWRKAPGEFGIGGRYPVKEVFAAAAGTWRGVFPDPSPLSTHAQALEAPGMVNLVVRHKKTLSRCEGEG